MSQSRNPPRDLAAEYSEHADAYARYWAPVIGPMARRLFGAMPITDAKRVLDLGCGTGDLLADLEAAAPSAVVLGVDHAAGMLLRASEKNDCPLAVMDARRLALPDRTLDGVILSFVLFHVPDPSAALREIGRVLRPGGTVGVVVWGESDPTPWDVIWREELDARVADPDPRDPSLVQHALMDTEEKLSKLLDTAGFDTARLWAERFEHTWEPGALFELQTSCGSHRRRIRTLPEAQRGVCRARVRERLAGLAPEQLVFRPSVVFAVAHSG